MSRGGNAYLLDCPRNCEKRARGSILGNIGGGVPHDSPNSYPILDCRPFHPYSDLASESWFAKPV